jgi:2-oxo-4-hydroxy-4-carboxy--5-ureidoimidazoline (OHCU) decarboxylase
MSSQPDRRPVAALAEAMQAALDSWDAGEDAALLAGRPDMAELAAATASLLSQYGYEIALIEPDAADW